jgi:hypothetical protein
LTFIVAPPSLIGKNETVNGIYNTSVGGNSSAATPGNNIGNYPPAEIPDNACDNDTSTKYLNFGLCNPYESALNCGLNTGLYLTPQRGASLVVALRLCAGNDQP